MPARNAGEGLPSLLARVDTGAPDGRVGEDMDSLAEHAVAHTGAGADDAAGGKHGAGYTRARPDAAASHSTLSATLAPSCRTT